MTTLLLNLRRVPDDEADEVRALLEQNRILFYETAPSMWGISSGGMLLSAADSVDATISRTAPVASEQPMNKHNGKAQRRRWVGVCVNSHCAWWDCWWPCWRYCW